MGSRFPDTSSCCKDSRQDCYGYVLAPVFRLSACTDQHIPVPALLRANRRLVPSTKEQLWQRMETPCEKKLGLQTERKRTMFLVPRISTSTARTSQVGQPPSRLSCCSLASL